MLVMRSNSLTDSPLLGVVCCVSAKCLDPSDSVWPRRSEYLRKLDKALLLEILEVLAARSMTQNFG